MESPLIWLSLLFIVLNTVPCQELPSWMQGINLEMANSTNITDCGTDENNEMECLDQRINQIFVNLNRLYSPEQAYTNISYLNHHIFNSTTLPSINSTIQEIFNSTVTEYSQPEINIIKTFPWRMIN